ncbi:hypothetical protein R1CP_38940 (plasmid) [Rhodococcus opacus]|uniref:Uncharacterized protein n=1 Tax=Rhodococcus opacus TaxID=37919 RepID=A0A1B1KID5_RHOOP|nr:hypothetical protein R1CP_38435 [Rhodococcus opacus]ANS32376.1 hypothetical protein R1CP_38940 [Rhodococcus opacus]
MPLLIIHAAIALGSLIAPRRVTEVLQRLCVTIAVMRANTRSMAAIGQTEFL